MHGGLLQVSTLRLVASNQKVVAESSRESLEKRRWSTYSMQRNECTRLTFEGRAQVGVGGAPAKGRTDVG